MQPFQQRVVDEKSALDEKICDLQAFLLTSPKLELVSADEKNRLLNQLHVMREYSAILGERIANFK